MQENQKEIILCPTRGGEPSYPNQDRAIALALKRDAELIFLHVSNARFVNRFASAVLVDLNSRLKEIGEFIVAMAQDRAESAGLMAGGETRLGAFEDALLESIRTSGATTLVLGAPTEGTGLTSVDYLKGLIEQLHSETGVAVIVVHNGDVVADYGAPARE